jgi:hypothetical protein
MERGRAGALRGHRLEAQPVRLLNELPRRGRVEDPGGGRGRRDPGQVFNRKQCHPHRQRVAAGREDLEVCAYGAGKRVTAHVIERRGVVLPVSRIGRWTSANCPEPSIERLLNNDSFALFFLSTLGHLCRREYG